MRLIGPEDDQDPPPPPQIDKQRPHSEADENEANETLEAKKEWVKSEMIYQKFWSQKEENFNTQILTLNKNSFLTIVMIM